MAPAQYVERVKYPTDTHQHRTASYHECTRLKSIKRPNNARQTVTHAASRPTVPCHRGTTFARMEVCLGLSRAQELGDLGLFGGREYSVLLIDEPCFVQPPPDRLLFALFCVDLGKMQQGFRPCAW